MVTTTLTVQSHLFADDHADAMAALGAMAALSAMEAASDKRRKRDSAAAMMIALRTKPMPHRMRTLRQARPAPFCCGEPRPRRVGTMWRP